MCVFGVGGVCMYVYIFICCDCFSEEKIQEVHHSTIQSVSLLVCLFFFMTSLCISLHNYLSLINICLFLQVTQHYRSTELHWMYALEQLLTLNGELVSLNIHFFIHKNYNYAISWTEILLELNHIILLLYNPLAFQLSCKVHTSWFRI